MPNRMAVARAVCADVDWSAVDRSMQVATTGTIARANARRRSLAESMARPIDREALRFVMDGLEAAAKRNVLANTERFDEIERLAMKANWKPEQETDEMVNINDVFAGASVRALDLQGRDCRVGITQVEVRDFDDGPKLVLHFHNSEKVLICNKTNANMIGEMFGAETNNWIGKVITLFPTKVEFGGKIVDAIRVRYEQPTTPQFGNAPASAPAAAPALTDGLGQPAPMPAQQQAAPPAERPIGGLGAQAPDPFEPAQGAPVSPAADLDDDIPFSPNKL